MLLCWRDGKLTGLEDSKEEACSCECGEIGDPAGTYGDRTPREHDKGNPFLQYKVLVTQNVIHRIVYNVLKGTLYVHLDRRVSGNNWMELRRGYRWCRKASRLYCKSRGPWLAFLDILWLSKTNHAWISNVFPIVPVLMRANFRLLQEIIAALTIKDLRVALERFSAWRIVFEVVLEYETGMNECETCLYLTDPNNTADTHKRRVG